MKPSILILFIVIIAFSACSHNIKSPLLGKEIIFTDSLISFDEGEFKTFKENIKGFKLIISLSGECPACTESINEWGKISETFEKELNIQSFFIMDIADTLAFKKMIYPNIPQHKNYVLNVDYHFQRKNNLMVPEILSHGLLLNNDNIIVHDSNILFDGTSIDDYLNEISSIIKSSRN